VTNSAVMYFVVGSLTLTEADAIGEVGKRPAFAQFEDSKYFQQPTLSFVESWSSNPGTSPSSAAALNVFLTEQKKRPIQNRHQRHPNFIKPCKQTSICYLGIPMMIMCASTVDSRCYSRLVIETTT
jgi:hypothetical protein